MKHISLAICLAALICANPALAQDDNDPGALITGARILDVVGPDMIEGRKLLIQDDLIAATGEELTAPEGATVIYAGGRVMTPGLIYIHEHLMMEMSSPELRFRDTRYKALVGGKIAGECWRRDP